MEIYLDNCATTKVCPEAVEAAMKAMAEDYGNPSSLHRMGLRAERLLTGTRKAAAALLGCDYGCIYLTGGATDSNNIAIQGAVRARARMGKTVVTTTVEHPSVAETVTALEKGGYTVKRVAPRPDGQFAPEDFLEAVDGDTVLLSMMMVNNELGTILPYEKVVPALKKRFPDLIVHIDGVQGFTKLPSCRKSWGLTSSPSPATSSTPPKGSAGCISGRGCGSCRSSTAAARKRPSAPAPRRSRRLPGWGRHLRW